MFTGTLIGITKTCGTLTGFITPAVVGAMTNKNASLIIQPLRASLCVAIQRNKFEKP